MCIDGRTRVFKTSESGREILLYQVGPGETCVLTTSCLMAGRPFPAESTAQTDVLHAALPASVFHRLLTASVPFRQFVLLATMPWSSASEQPPGQPEIEAGKRHLVDEGDEWERVGWVRASRGSSEVRDPRALASYGASNTA